MAILIALDSRVSVSDEVLSRLSPDIQILRIDAGSDGIRGIANWLKTGATAGTSYSSLEIVSHGSPGRVLLGNAELSSDTLPAYLDELRTIGESLADGGDIRFYGCDVGQGETARSFLQTLSDITGADIAASDDSTGASFLGGDAQLEVQIGAIDAPTVFSAVEWNASELLLATMTLNYGSTTNGPWTQAAGSHEFAINGVPYSSVVNTDYYRSLNGLTGNSTNVSNYQYVGSHSGYVGTTNDPELLINITNTSTVWARVYKGGGSFEDHFWNVTVLRPDGVVRDILMNSATTLPSVRSGDNVRLDFQVDNEGTADVPSGATLTWYWGATQGATSNRIDSGNITGPLAGTVAGLNGLQPGEATTETDASWTIPTLAAGNYWLSAVLSNASGETDTADNLRSEQFTVLPPGNTVTGIVYSPDRFRGSTPVTLDRIDSSSPIDPSLETWIVIHGRQSSFDPSSSMWELAQAVDLASGTAQVLTLDWRSGAAPLSISDLTGESFIEPLAQWVGDVLTKNGLVSSNINLIGHSWGGVMTAEIAEEMTGGVNRLISLDPAQDGSLWGSLGFDSNAVNFAADSAFSWAFLSSEFGSGESVPTADAAFMVDIDGDAWAGTPAHSHIVQLFAEMLERNAAGVAGSVSSVFELSDVSDSGRIWINNSFDGNAVTGRHVSTPGQYEGVLYAEQVSDTRVLIPVSFEYRNLSGNYVLANENMSPPKNIAPSLIDTLATLSGMTEDVGAPSGVVGTLVSSLVGGQSDADAGALKGIAVTAANTSSGSWLFSTDNGSHWTSLGSVSISSARLLAADANTRVYFKPNTDFNGTVSDAITFRAWDRTTGSNGGTGNASANGGSTAFSATSDTAAITVNAVNDAPSVNSEASVSVVENTTVTGYTATRTDPDAGDTVRWSISGTDAAMFTIGASTGVLSFQRAPDFENPTDAGANNVYDVTAIATDAAGASGSKNVQVRVTDLNDAAVTARPVNTVAGAQNGMEDTSIVFSGANAITVSDIDSTTLTTTLSVGNGTLTLGGTAGVIVSGNGTGTVQLVGTVAAINTALNGTSFTPTADYNGAVTLTVSTTDGALTDSDTVGITLAAVADIANDPSTTFDGLAYIASHPDLINAFGANADAGARHYITNGILEGRHTTFDALKYTASYGDLINAFGTNTTAAVADYITNGYAKGRTATFDALKYTATYGDLITAFGTNTTAAATHYIANGYAEGRSATFDTLKYTASYPDLIKAFGTNTTAAETHYITNGYAEGRTATFDALKYTASYGDLINAFGTNTTAAETHYITNGYAEGRTATFDALKYTASYGDLINAFGTNTTAAETHYITNGYAEGRTATFDALKYTASYVDLINAFGTNTTAAETHYIANGYAEGRTATFDGQSYVLANLDLLAAFGLDAVAGARHYITNGIHEGRQTSLSSTRYGGAGDEVLIGTTGKDLLDGGPGHDTLTGLGGQDIFVLRAGDGGAALQLADVITDFQDGTGRLGLAGSLQYADMRIQQGTGTYAAATIISTSSGEYLAILNNLLATNISSQDFVHL